ncbi:hypothetical protein [Endozoicomonas sp. ALB115]
MPEEGGAQKNIAQALVNMDADLLNLASRLSKHQKLKQGMMQNLLTGTVRLV